MGVVTINKNILYIGKDAKVLKDIASWLDKEYDIYHLNTPIEAFSWMRGQKRKPLLILIEDIFKHVDVLEYCKLLHQRFGANIFKIILLTASSGELDSLKALKHGVVDAIDKTVFQHQEKRLRSILKNALKKEVYNQEPTNDLEIPKLPLWKRSFDLLVGGTAVLLLSPLLIVVAILIKLDSKGPIFYISKRVGRGYKVFDFYKFRTMKVGADKELHNLKKEHNQYQDQSKSIEFEERFCANCIHSNCTQLVVDDYTVCEHQFLEMSKVKQAAFVKLKKDPRITRLGRFLRNTSIDELPQLLNILKGDMSIVGNRPLPLYEAEQLTTDQGVKRFVAPAGLTGLWQVRKRGKAEMSEEERKNLDNEYAEQYSFWMDLKLIIQTVGVFIQKENV